MHAVGAGIMSALVQYNGVATATGRKAEEVRLPGVQLLRICLVRAAPKHEGVIMQQTVVRVRVRTIAVAVDHSHRAWPALPALLQLIRIWVRKGRRGQRQPRSEPGGR